jgi:low temperature requirement protein LtrA
LVDIGVSWPASRSTTVSPPGATHFPGRFGLLTIILLGELVASVMRGIESQMGWSFLAASAAVLSIALGFAIWSCYSDGAMGWEARHVRSHKDVMRLRAWIVLHLALFLGIGVLGVGLRRAIALPPGGHFSDPEQWIICAATACIILVIMGVAATSERHVWSGRRSVWLSQSGIALGALTLAPLSTWIIATGILLLLLLCFAAQIVVLVANRRLLAGRGESGCISPRNSRRHRRRLQFIFKNAIRGLARIILRQMNSLRRKIDRLKCALRFLRRQTFLAPGHCPTQSGCE